MHDREAVCPAGGGLIVFLLSIMLAMLPSWPYFRCAVGSSQPSSTASSGVIIRTGLIPWHVSSDGHNSATNIASAPLVETGIHDREAVLGVLIVSLLTMMLASASVVVVLT